MNKKAVVIIAISTYLFFLLMTDLVDRFTGEKLRSPIVQAIEPTATDEDLCQHVVVLELNWDTGHSQVASSEPLTITQNLIVLEIRDERGNVIAAQTQPVGDCQVVYDEADLPTGICGSGVPFTMTIPCTGHFEEWVQGVYVAINGKTYTYTVPARPQLEFGEDGFSLIGVLGEEWYDICPPDPATATLLPTATEYATQIPYPTEPPPTCRWTATLPPPQETFTPRPTPTPLPTYTAYPTQPP